jgi:hypothetical protein
LAVLDHHQLSAAAVEHQLTAAGLGCRCRFRRCRCRRRGDARRSMTWLGRRGSGGNRSGQEIGRSDASPRRTGNAGTGRSVGGAEACGPGPARNPGGRTGTAGGRGPGQGRSAGLRWCQRRLPSGGRGFAGGRPVRRRTRGRARWSIDPQHFSRGRGAGGAQATRDVCDRGWRWGRRRRHRQQKRSQQGSRPPDGRPPGHSRQPDGRQPGADGHSAGGRWPAGGTGARAATPCRPGHGGRAARASPTCGAGRAGVGTAGSEGTISAGWGHAWTRSER